MTDDKQFCERCGRRFPGWESDEAIHWEDVLRDDGSDGLICGGCMTQEELIERAEFTARDDS